MTPSIVDEFRGLIARAKDVHEEVTGRREQQLDADCDAYAARLSALSGEGEPGGIAADAQAVIDSSTAWLHPDCQLDTKEREWHEKLIRVARAALRSAGEKKPWHAESRIRHWIQNFGYTSQPPFIADLTALLTYIRPDVPVIPPSPPPPAESEDREAETEGKRYRIIVRAIADGCPDCISRRGKLLCRDCMMKVPDTAEELEAMEREIFSEPAKGADDGAT